MKLLSYYRARFQYPELRDYVDMGLGIEARYLRCKAFWKRHIELSKAFQARQCGRCKEKGVVAVLGAGRLFDVDEEALGAFKSIHLFDADPTVRPAWKKMRQRLTAQQELVEHIGDITGSISSWTSSMQNYLRQHPSNDLPGFSKLLDSLAVDAARIGNYDVLVSLNLLSQLGIYWRERVELALGKAWGIRLDQRGCLPEPVEKALARSQKRIEQSHLDMLATSGASVVVLINDAFYLYYRKDSAQWQEEPALGVSQISLPGYALSDEDTWFWHIAPQDIEQPEYGAIHQVQARCFTRV